MVNNNIKSVLITDDVNEKCVQILENNDLKVVKNTKTFCICTSTSSF